jgi:uncharacterized protein (DUF4415 family)
VRKRNSKSKSGTDWAKVDAMPDDAIDYSEIPELDADFFKNAVWKMPDPKASITLRVDRDVLEWFKQQGPRYQTRINALMRAYMESQIAALKER